MWCFHYSNLPKLSFVAIFMRMFKDSWLSPYSNSNCAYIRYNRGISKWSSPENCFAAVRASWYTLRAYKVIIKNMSISYLDIITKINEGTYFFWLIITLFHLSISIPQLDIGSLIIQQSLGEFPAPNNSNISISVSVSDLAFIRSPPPSFFLYPPFVSIARLKRKVANGKMIVMFFDRQ